MRVPTRLLLVLSAVVAAGVGFVSPSKAVESPVVVMVVPCDASEPVTSLVGAPAGVYTATVVGVCTPDKDNEWPVGTPCSTSTTGPIPCATVSNLPGLLCWTSVSAVTVSTCGPGTSVTPTTCPAGTFSVKVNDQCLSTVPGLIGQVTHGGGLFTARFEDGVPATDNAGAFLVVLRLAV